MTISDMIKELEEIREVHGDIPVLVEGRDSSIYDIFEVEHHLAEEGEFPDEWNIPDGLSFAKIIVE